MCSEKNDLNKKQNGEITRPKIGTLFRQEKQASLLTLLRFIGDHSLFSITSRNIIRADTINHLF